jgi:hypothetical protein
MWRPASSLPSFQSLYPVLRIRIRDPVLFYPPEPGSGSGMEQWSDPDPGSGMKHPGSATLRFYLYQLTHRDMLNTGTLISGSRNRIKMLRLHMTAFTCFIV